MEEWLTQIHLEKGHSTISVKHLAGAHSINPNQ